MQLLFCYVLSSFLSNIIISKVPVCLIDNTKVTGYRLTIKLSRLIE